MPDLELVKQYKEKKKIERLSIKEYNKQRRKDILDSRRYCVYLHKIDAHNRKQGFTDSIFNYQGTISIIPRAINWESSRTYIMNPLLLFGRPSRHYELI